MFTQRTAMLLLAAFIALASGCGFDNDVVAAKFEQGPHWLEVTVLVGEFSTDYYFESGDQSGVTGIAVVEDLHSGNFQRFIKSLDSELLATVIDGLDARIDDATGTEQEILVDLIAEVAQLAYEDDSSNASSQADDFGSLGSLPTEL